METVDRFLSIPSRSCILFGPRGTGKTFWIRHSFSKYYTIDLLKSDVYQSYLSAPSRLRGLVDANPEYETIVIDEIQKVPALLDEIHYLIENHPNVRFILTGSSARKLKGAGADLLAGRAVEKHLHPFMAAELEHRFSLEQALIRGLLPVVMAADDPAEVLKTYVSLYIREEVQQEGLVRNIGGFTRFIEAIAFSHASLLNVSNIARECQAERKTIEGYISILEDLLLAFRTPVFAKRAKRATVAHAKFYLFDAGVFRSVRPKGPLDRPAEIDGAALEGLVAQHLRAWTDYAHFDARLHFWRTRSGVEVDFVLYGEGVFLAIEVKNALRIAPADLRGLKTFKNDYPDAGIMLLYRGKERIVINDVLCVPVDEFLLSLHPSKPLPFIEKPCHQPIR